MLRLGRALRLPATMAALVFGLVAQMSPPPPVPVPLGADAPRFDVVSIKLNNGKPGPTTPGEFPVNGTWERPAVFLQTLVGLAYNIPTRSVAGVPASFVGQSAARFEIRAKTAAGVREQQFRLMLQAMLTGRFHLVVHGENRDVAVNILEVANGGPKLQPPSGNCLKDLPLSAPLPDGQNRCGVVTHKFITPDGSPLDGLLNEYTGFSVTTGELAAMFGQTMPVVDETGLTGTYDIKLDLPMTIVQAGTLTPAEQQQHTADVYHSTDEAFRKTLGLSLDLGSAKKRPLPVLVIDHVEMPSPD